MVSDELTGINSAAWRAQRHEPHGQEHHLPQQPDVIGTPNRKPGGTWLAVLQSLTAALRSYRRLRQEDVAAYLIWRQGGKLTDSIEREIERTLLSDRF